MERLKFESGRPLPDEFLLELGRMTAMWPRLEFGLDLVIGRLMGFDLHDVRPVIAFAHANFQQRVEVFSTLCNRMQANHSQLKNYKSVLTKIQGAQKGRNKYAHNVITPNSSGKMVVTPIAARDVFKMVPEPVYLNDIKEVTAKILEAAGALHSLVIQVQDINSNPEVKNSEAT